MAPIRATLPARQSNLARGMDDAYVTESAIALRYGQAKPVQCAPRDSMAPGPALINVLRGVLALGTAGVLDPGAVIAMLGGRGRTARPVSRTSTDQHLVMRSARSHQHAQAMGDAHRSVIAPACCPGRARTARRA